MLWFHKSGRAITWDGGSVTLPIKPVARGIKPPKRAKGKKGGRGGDTHVLGAMQQYLRVACTGTWESERNKQCTGAVGHWTLRLGLRHGNLLLLWRCRR
jgi:hypothetical protein